MHHIQKHILKVLTYQAQARFSELRPPRTDTNLFSYHLKSLLRSGLVSKGERSYSLSATGLLYVDRISSERFEQRAQAKIITATIFRDEAGRVALVKRNKQPFIDSWGLPSGKIHLGETVAEGARREALEKTGLRTEVPLQHIGDGYIHSYVENQLVSSVLVHVFEGGVVPSEECASEVKWVAWPEASCPLLPGTAALIEKALTCDGQRFFIELVERR